jgi:predicted nucleic acid-binding protein
MTKVLLDISVVLDLLLNRTPWAADAARIWDAHRQRQIDAILAAFSLPTIFYIARRQTDLPTAGQAVDACLATLTIQPVDRGTLAQARLLPGSDFEDNLQIASAIQAGAQAIITRDPRGFAHSPIPVMSPSDLVTQLTGPSGTSPSSP